eukprot:c11889_g1_i5.p2 GENE.c11889_g1_i5~~c11889_g1_i5.p2  ORF type:complete len:113 (+),score=19.15 c11889_g1_i5:1069-1407(+)
MCSCDEQFFWGKSRKMTNTILTDLRQLVLFVMVMYEPPACDGHQGVLTDWMEDDLLVGEAQTKSQAVHPSKMLGDQEDWLPQHCPCLEVVFVQTEVDLLEALQWLELALLQC